MFIKPVTKIEQKSELHFVSLADCELDRECTSKESIEQYQKGIVAAASNFVWKGDCTTFICKPLSKSAWYEVQLEATAKAHQKQIETGEYIYGLLTVLVFSQCFRSLECGSTKMSRAECFENIPLNVRQEIGHYLIAICTQLDPF